MKKKPTEICTLHKNSFSSLNKENKTNNRKFKYIAFCNIFVTNKKKECKKCFIHWNTAIILKLKWVMLISSFREIIWKKMDFCMVFIVSVYL